jgi:hypothetical protein
MTGSGMIIGPIWGLAIKTHKTQRVPYGDLIAVRLIVVERVKNHIGIDESLDNEGLGKLTRLIISGVEDLSREVLGLISLTLESMKKSGRFLIHHLFLLYESPPNPLVPLKICAIGVILWWGAKLLSPACGPFAPACAVAF